MGMTIEEARTALGKERKYALHENKQAFDIAIDTMRKYQKIQNIVRDYYNEQYTDKLDIEIIEMISEVLEGDRRWED